MRAVAAGIALPSVSALLAACTDDPTAEGGPPVKLLAPSPPMGRNSWNVYGDDIDEEKILRTADAIIDSGMRDAGWEYVMLDDGWQKIRGSRSAAAAVRDLWAHRDLGVSTGRFATTVRSHEATIFRVTPQASG